MSAADANLQNRTKLQEINQALDEGWLQTPSDAVNSNDDAV
ncbi:hypothetical protein [Iningainema tapete]|nr:hypothetical protein [Iningainema tapete]